MIPTLEKKTELFLRGLKVSYFFYSIFLYASTEIGPKVFLLSCRVFNGCIFRRLVVDFMVRIEALEIMLAFMLSVGVLFSLLLKIWLLLVFRVTLNFFFLAKFKFTFTKFLRLRGSYVFSLILSSRWVRIHCTNYKLSWYFILISF